MAAKTAAQKPQDVIEKVQNLVALAQSDNENEARNAALSAVRLMTEHKLAVVPQEDLEKAKAFVENAQKLLATAKDKKTQNMMMGAALGFFAAKRF
jgi:hypothetical protein